MPTKKRCPENNRSVKVHAGTAAGTATIDDGKNDGKTIDGGEVDASKNETQDPVVSEIGLWTEDSGSLYCVPSKDFDTVRLKRGTGLAEFQTGPRTCGGLAKKSDTAELFYGWEMDAGALMLNKIEGYVLGHPVYAASDEKKEEARTFFKKRETKEQEDARLKNLLHLHEKMRTEAWEEFKKPAA
ncbi:MAG: uncharacterized protein A8A55_2221 [Amphiamblys sp. WSBS2006]|nr:MAG: uncharacterized protein A8A55_2221 [Amphiamblys sp. WSBS2006]